MDRQIYAVKDQQLLQLHLVAVLGLNTHEQPKFVATVQRFMRTFLAIHAKAQVQH